MTISSAGPVVSAPPAAGAIAATSGAWTLSLCSGPTWETVYQYRTPGSAVVSVHWISPVLPSMVTFGWPRLAVVVWRSMVP